MFRGDPPDLGQRPALQVGLDFVRLDGWSAGTCASTISNRIIESGRVEWNLYGGYSGTAGEAGNSLMAYYYLYPGTAISATRTKSTGVPRAGGKQAVSTPAKNTFAVSVAKTFDPMERQ